LTFVILVPLKATKLSAGWEKHSGRSIRVGIIKDLKVKKAFWSASNNTVLRELLTYVSGSGLYQSSLDNLNHTGKVKKIDLINFRS